MNEDELTNKLIRDYRNEEERDLARGDTDAEVELYPEEHYDHYGKRGVVDLYAVTGGWQGHLYEIKSESAVRAATGANQIIRQFNRMRQYFYPGSEHSVPTSYAYFELCFTPTEYNARHLISNADMYLQSMKNDLANLRGVEPRVNIGFRMPDPENTGLLPAFMTDSHYNDITTDGFEEYAERTAPEIYDRVEPALE